MEVSDEQLGALVDGELGALERSRIEQQLRMDAGARRRLGAIEAVTMSVRAATAANGKKTKDSSPRGFGAWRDWRIAAAFAAGAVVLLGVLSLTARFGGADIDWKDNALAFHDMYLRAQENNPADAMLEIVQHQPDELAQLISFPPSLPDLAVHGYAPAGAHVVAAPQGPFVYVVFDGEERPPVGFAMARSRAGGTVHGTDEPAVRMSESGVNLVSWSAGTFEYALSGQLPPGDLLQLAETVRASLPAQIR